MGSESLFHIISLGCPKNRVDTERIMAVMQAAGHRYTAHPERAAVLVVNTCAFVQPAVEESIEAIFDLRHENPDALLVVAGCLPLRYGDELTDALAEADLFARPEDIPDLPALVAAQQRAGEAADATRTPPGHGSRLPAGYGDAPSPAGPAVSFAPRVLTTPGFGYLKIAEGCSRRCHYCTIPAIRGPLRSASPDDLARETELLCSQGIRELILVAQDVTAYGTDRARGGNLVDLLRLLDKVADVPWIRLMYLHPAGIPKELPDIINASNKILPYLDIPLQHVSQRVLRAMGRPGNRAAFARLLEWLRKEIPGLVLRTTLMVGHPGEGEEEFRGLLEFVQEHRIDRLGAFAYSPEEGTRSASHAAQVPEEVREERLIELMELHGSAQTAWSRERIGSEELCLVQGFSEETELLLHARAWDQAPEVDGAVYITDGVGRVGELELVRFTDSYGPDLFGAIVSSGHG